MKRLFVLVLLMACGVAIFAQTPQTSKHKRAQNDDTDKLYLSDASLNYK